MDILEMVSKLARITYTNEFCSNCGRAIMIDEAKIEVFKDSNITASFVHKDCFQNQMSEKTWSSQSKSL